MGKHRKGFRGNKRSRDDGTYVEHKKTYTNSKGYVLHAKESKLFEQYYQGQKIVPENEWSSFMEALLRPLPCTFRVTGFKSHAKEMLSIIKKDYLNTLLEGNGGDEEQSKSLKCLQWYPDELAWQLDIERKAIRQDSKLKKLHQFLIQETESGYISRQEAVSMIPPLVLDVQPNSKVLDMCAAPGSKTSQLIESLHFDEDEETKPSEGFVVANDSDNKRCYLMVHQLNRLLSPNFVVTNMDASIMPNFLSFESEGDSSNTIKFDRILCDVPCSGDGTLRKNVDAWQRWNPGSAHGLHNLQKRILKRGIEMLTDGGKIVYSTCSFNPVEDEAVVAHILRTMKGAVELVDISDKLPGLLFESGRNQWRVMTKNEQWFENFQEVPENLHTQLAQSLFPPTQEEADLFNLHRCIRILPHKQDTGGFFVALLQKTNNSKPADEEEQVDAEKKEIVKDEDNTKEAGQEEDGSKKRKGSENNSRPAKKAKHFGYKEDPFIFLKQDDEIWKPIVDFYGISDDFPFSQLMVRCDQGKKRNIYFVSSTIKSLVQQNENKFKFINFGVKILGRSLSKDVDCQFRLVQDGLHLLYPYITKRIVEITKDDVVTLLSSENPYISRFSKSASDAMEAIEQGGCIFVYKPHLNIEGPQCKLVLSGWKGKVSCRSFIPRADRGHFLRLCGVELSVNGNKEKKATNSEKIVECDNDVIETDENMCEEESDVNVINTPAEEDGDCDDLDQSKEEIGKAENDIVREPVCGEGDEILNEART